VAFQLYTDRARRVVVFAQEECWRNGAAEITNEHKLIALARDAVTPWPEDDPPGSTTGLPVREPISLALRVLGEFDISADNLVAETYRLTGLITPPSLAAPGPQPGERPAAAFEAKWSIACRFEVLLARRRHDNHLSTLHQLVGVESLRKRPAHAILASLGVPNARAIRRAARVVDDECREMQRQMSEIALDQPALQKELTWMIPGSTSGLRKQRRRRERSSTTP
jgi:hypothetical protein